MLRGITTTLLFGLPLLPAPSLLVKALQRIEIETSIQISQSTCSTPARISSARSESASCSGSRSHASERM